MLFVTVGTIPFPRLVAAMDRFAAQAVEEVVIQSADQGYHAAHAQLHTYIADMEQYFSDARIIVTHCGVGTLYRVLQARKPAVILPRRAHLGEHFDDHQWDMACRMRDALPFVIADDADNIAASLEQAPERHAAVPYRSTRAQLTAALTKDISELTKHDRP